MINDFLKRNIAIRERVCQKYWEMLLLYTLHIFIILIGYIFVYQAYKGKGICPLNWFLLFIILGEFIVVGFTGLVQLILVYKQKRKYSVEMLGKINLIMCLIHLVFSIILGIRPQKISMLILGIVLSVFFTIIILFSFGVLYSKVNTFNELCIVCKIVEQSISDYGGIEIYNQYVDLYNNMNGEIENIGLELGEENKRKKRVSKRNIMEDLEDMLRKIPGLDISDIRIYSFGRWKYAYRIRAYIKGIYKFSSDVKKILEKAKEQIAKMDDQINKKEELIDTMNVALNNMSWTENLRKVDFEAGYENLRGSYKKLKKKSRVERKIKSIKRGIFR